MSQQREHGPLAHEPGGDGGRRDEGVHHVVAMAREVGQRVDPPEVGLGQPGAVPQPAPAVPTATDRAAALACFGPGLLAAGEKLDRVACAEEVRRDVVEVPLATPPDLGPCVGMDETDVHGSIRR
jgi:hypothetical protein